MVMFWSIVLTILIFALGVCVGVIALCKKHLADLDELMGLYDQYRDSCNSIFKLDDDIIADLKKLSETKSHLITLYETLISKTYIRLVDLRDNHYVDGLDEVIGDLGEALGNTKENSND